MRVRCLTFQIYSSPDGADVTSMSARCWELKHFSRHLSAETHVPWNRVGGMRNWLYCNRIYCNIFAAGLNLSIYILVCPISLHSLSLIFLVKYKFLIILVCKIIYVRIKHIYHIYRKQCQLYIHIMRTGVLVYQSFITVGCFRNCQHYPASIATLAQRWPNVNPYVGPTSAHQRWANVDLSIGPTVAQRWRANVGPTLCQHRPNVGTLTLGQRWHNVTPMVVCQRCTNIGPTEAALLTFCEGNPSVTDGFPSQRVRNAGVDVCLNNRLNKQSSSVTGDLRH